MSMLTTAEAAAVLRESPITTMRRCTRGQLPAKKIGREWRISEAALEAFLTPDNTPTKDEPVFLTASQKRRALRHAS